MKINYSLGGSVSIELSLIEARALLYELSNVRGGARLPKLRQVCESLENLFVLLSPRRASVNTRKLKIV